MIWFIRFIFKFMVLYNYHNLMHYLQNIVNIILLAKMKQICLYLNRYDFKNGNLIYYSFIDFWGLLTTTPTIKESNLIYLKLSTCFPISPLLFVFFSQQKGWEYLQALSHNPAVSLPMEFLLSCDMRLKTQSFSFFEF